MDGNIFDRRISVYRDKTDTIGAVVTLGQFLFSTRHVPEIEHLRSVEDADERKRLKGLLPAATISGIFSKRGEAGLLNHSGLICIDLDSKDNPGMDAEQTKQQLAEFQEIVYIGLSVGGKGLFCVVPIAYPDKHKAHYRALEDDFRALGLITDSSCKDVCRMRVVSYDPNPYINYKAVEYTHTKQQSPTPIRHFSYDDSGETVGKVYELCRQIQAAGVDITDGYLNWFEVGASLASLGEDGREAFHVVSSQNATYDYSDTQRKFDNLLRTVGGYSIGTFFHLCKCCGLDT